MRGIVYNGSGLWMGKRYRLGGCRRGYTLGRSRRNLRSRLWHFDFNGLNRFGRLYLRHLDLGRRNLRHRRRRKGFGNNLRFDRFNRLRRKSKTYLGELVIFLNGLFGCRPDNTDDDCKNDIYSNGSE
jgi:hypothetical protein